MMANNNNNLTRFVTYNMHGWNNGLSALLELCNDPTIRIIGVQEHWLHGDNVNLLNNVHPEFVGFGLSSMNSRLSSEIYRGRPFGGVGFLWRKSISNNVQITSRADSGRSLCISCLLYTSPSPRD